ncbi:hypothetical protein PMAYCL1PPCAC_09407 [Pristionchus mayeri]|uniref:Uncharacterized protein n=1 Tax=Pristionchus mayeri TaxID=1317129 RepID=A0AAN5CD90_9BILA|nr:hypothetical protein PMAYCL1PPCAC_09407 [Pristionchus mayeri]
MRQYNIEKAELNRKIQELQEEISDMEHEKDALDKAERANVELNMRRPREKITELTEENRNQTQKCQTEKEQLNMIIDLQNRNLTNEMRMTGKMNERYRIKEEENSRAITDLRQRMNEIENNRMRRGSDTIAVEDDDTVKNIRGILADIKQYEDSVEIRERDLIETTSTPAEMAPETTTVPSSPKPSKSATEVAALSPVPNDPTSPPPSPPPPLPPSTAPPLQSLTRTPLRFTSRTLDEYSASQRATGSSSANATTPEEARSNLMNELQTTLTSREEVLEQARRGWR